MSAVLRKFKAEAEARDKQRSRWRRWLGAVCREDMPTWVELLSGHWAGWLHVTLGDAATHISPDKATREDVKEQWAKAIGRATPSQLGRLDALFCEDMMEKKKRSNKRRKR